MNLRTDCKDCKFLQDSNACKWGKPVYRDESGVLVTDGLCRTKALQLLSEDCTLDKMEQTIDEWARKQQATAIVLFDGDLLGLNRTVKSLVDVDKSVIGRVLVACTNLSVEIRKAIIELLSTQANREWTISHVVDPEATSDFDKIDPSLIKLPWGLVVRSGDRLGDVANLIDGFRNSASNHILGYFDEHDVRMLFYTEAFASLGGNQVKSFAKKVLEAENAEKVCKKIPIELLS